MSLYYLMAQLPSLDNVSESSPLPITEERFLELCRQFSGKRAWCAIDGLKLVPDRDGSFNTSTLIDAWNINERRLRLALATARAERLGRVFDPGEVLSEEALKVAREASEITDPLSAERFLCNVQMKFLESLRPMDSFSEDALYYYGLKLKLLERFRRFDRERGTAEYKRIYDSVLDGAGQEELK